MSNGGEFDIALYGDSGLTGQLVAGGADRGGALNELVVGFQKRGAFPLPFFSYWADLTGSAGRIKSLMKKPSRLSVVPSI